MPRSCADLVAQILHFSRGIKDISIPWESDLTVSLAVNKRHDPSSKTQRVFLRFCSCCLLVFYPTGILKVKAGFKESLNKNIAVMRKLSIVRYTSAFCYEIFQTKDDFIKFIVLRLRGLSYTYALLKISLQRYSLKDLLNQHR